MGKKNKILLASESILKSMPEFAYVFDKNNKLVMWNKKLESILGYSEDELYGKDLFDFIEDDSKDSNIEAINKIFNLKEEQSLEQNILTKSAEKIPVVDTAHYALINGEEYLIGMAIDISKQREFENKLKAQIHETNKLKNLISAENVYLQKELFIKEEFSGIFGKSAALVKALLRIKQIAKTNTAVLIEGERGTRKSVYARNIYKKSERTSEPFIGINCSRLNKDNFEKEFYNSLKEIFTEVDKSEKGKFIIINHGTLFIEEISAIPVHYQSKLCKALKSGKIAIKGCTQVIYFDIRLIASTSQDLEVLLDKKLFSKNLYALVNKFNIKIPPLRERIDDIPILIDNYLKIFNEKFGKKISKISKRNMVLLQNYSWPGNTRELEILMERSMILSDANLLKIEPLNASQNTKIFTLDEYQKSYIIEILNLSSWRIAGDKGAAKILGLHPETLRSKMRKLKIIKK